MLFIVGRGRSGTTLLARLLTQHSSITVAPEGTFVLGLRRTYGAGAAGPTLGARFVSDLLRERRMQSWHLEVAALARRLQALPAPASYARLCREVYASYAEDTLGRAISAWLGDKNPPHALFVEPLAELFPDARFVHVTRDPRDNVRSYREVDFDLGDEVALAWRWRRYNERVLAARRRMPERFVHVRFEALVRQPERELTRVCAHLGLDFEPSMLAAHEPGPKASPDAKPGWFQVPLGPVDASAARGPCALPLPARHAVDSICGELAEQLGYPRGDSLPWPSSARLRLLPGLALGASSVVAEQLLFGHAPLPLRAGLVNGYRRALGRL
jgi:hypothetical protein